MYMSDMSPGIDRVWRQRRFLRYECGGFDRHKDLSKTSLFGLLVVGNGQLLADSGFGGGGECQIDYSTSHKLIYFILRQVSNCARGRAGAQWHAGFGNPAWLPLSPRTRLLAAAT